MIYHRESCGLVELQLQNPFLCQQHLPGAPSRTQDACASDAFEHQIIGPIVVGPYLFQFGDQLMKATVWRMRSRQHRAIQAYGAMVRGSR